MWLWVVMIHQKGLVSLLVTITPIDDVKGLGQ
jgi:hypothetical protein